MAINVITTGHQFGRLRALWDERRRRLLLADLLDLEVDDFDENARLTEQHYSEVDRLERRMSALPVICPDDLRVMAALLAVKTEGDEGAFPDIDAAAILRAIDSYAASLALGRVAA